MDLTTVAILAEIRAKILETAVMLNSGYTEEEILNHLLETVDYLNNFSTVTNKRG